jgi:DNA gyrase subunit A
VIKDDLLEIAQAYADERRTEIVPDEGEINIEDLIADRGLRDHASATAATSSACR